MKLGDILKDKYSPIQGVAVIKTVHFNGMERFTISYEKDMESKDTSFDNVQLEVITSAEEDVTPKLNGHVDLGDRVQDIATGFEGMLTGFYYYLNGCVRYEVCGLDHQTRLPAYIALDEANIRKIEAKKEEPQGPPRTGGSTSMIAMR